MLKTLFFLCLCSICQDSISPGERRSEVLGVTALANARPSYQRKASSFEQPRSGKLTSKFEYRDNAISGSPTPTMRILPRTSAKHSNLVLAGIRLYLKGKGKTGCWKRGFRIGVTQERTFGPMSCRSQDFQWPRRGLVQTRHQIRFMEMQASRSSCYGSGVRFGFLRGWQHRRYDLQCACCVRLQHTSALEKQVMYVILGVSCHFEDLRRYLDKSTTKDELDRLSRRHQLASVCVSC